MLNIGFIKKYFIHLGIGVGGYLVRTKSTDRDKLTANRQFRHSDFVTNFVIVISSLSEGLGQMALGIVKYFYDRPS